MTILFSNNAQTTIAGSINTTATSVTFSAGTGVEFPNPGSNQFFTLTHINATTGLPDEIVYVTAMSTDTATIVRAREGTTAVNWSSGDTVVNQLTAGGLSYYAQQQGVQQNAYNYGADTGLVNAYIVTLSPTPILQSGFPLIFSTANSNTTINPTVTVNGTTVNITGPGGVSLVAGQIPANAPVELIYNSTGPRFELQGLSAVNHGALIDYQIITSTTTYTKATNNPNYVIVEVWGGGGGGGGCNTSADSAAGGGAGGFTRMKILASSLISSETVTIGSGGAGGTTSGTTGSSGGTSSFGSHCSATGGAGGLGSTSQTNSTGGVGGAGTGGDLNLTGQAGFATASWSGGSRSGEGGTTTLGGNGVSVQYGPAGVNAVANSGSGGSGASTNSSVARAGGNGGSGLVIIWEYA